jgi:hypothetical protein
VEASDFSLVHSVQKGSGANSVPYSMDTDALSPGVKRQKREADHSSPSSAEVDNDGNITPLPDTSSWPGALLPKHREYITCMLLIAYDKIRKDQTNRF